MSSFFLNNYLVLCNRVSSLVYPELSAEGLGIFLLGGKDVASLL